MAVTDHAPNPRLYVTKIDEIPSPRRPVDLDMRDDIRVMRAETAITRTIDLDRLEDDIAQSRLDRLKELARSLTYGEMMEWAKGQVADKPVTTWEEFAARFHAWTMGRAHEG